MQLSKKLSSLVLALALVLTMFPMQALAKQDTQAYAKLVKLENEKYSLQFFNDEPNKYIDREMTSDGVIFTNFENNFDGINFGFRDLSVYYKRTSGDTLTKYEAKPGSLKVEGYHINSTPYIQEVSFNDIIQPTKTANWFYQMVKLKSVENPENLYLSNVKDITNMFAGCNSLNIDVNVFDTKTVENFQNAFSGTKPMESVIELDTSNATTLKGMFSETKADNVDELDITKLKTSKVTDMSSLFADSEMSEIDMSGIDTSKVKNMSYMFKGCTNLKEVDVEKLNTSNCTNFGNLFDMYNTTPNKKLKEIDMRSWSATSGVNTIYAMFRNLTNLEKIYTSDAFDLRKVNPSGDGTVFKNCPKLPNWDTNAVTKAKGHNNDGGYFTNPAKELAEKIESLPKLDRTLYSEETLAQYDNLIQESKALSKNPTAPIDAYEEQAAKIDEFIRNMPKDQEKINYRSELQPAVQIAESIPLRKYTDDTAAVLANAINAAKAVLANENSTKEELGTALSNLRLAINGLKLKPTNEITPINPASTKAIKKMISKQKNDKDVKGSTFRYLRLKGKPSGKNGIKLSWAKVPGATKYIVYGNLCSATTKKKEMKTLTTNKMTIKKINGKKLEKGEHYKFVVLAVNGDTTFAVSKALHVVTKGNKKYTNPKKLVVSDELLTRVQNMKTGDKVKLKAKIIKAKGKKINVHRSLRFECDDPTLATITRNGTTTVKATGETTVYAYAQNGACTSFKLISLQ